MASQITTDQIKTLRDQTGISVMLCRTALEEAGGDMEKAKVILRRKSADAAAKKADRNLGAGTIAAYIHHGGTVGAMVELSCETDFVSGSETFRALAYDIAMQVAATAPEFIQREDIDTKASARAREVLRTKEGEAKVNSCFSEKILLEQPFIKNPEVTVQNLIEDAIQKFGEKIEITRFARFSVGTR